MNMASVKSSRKWKHLYYGKLKIPSKVSSRTLHGAYFLEKFSLVHRCWRQDLWKATQQLGRQQCRHLIATSSETVCRRTKSELARTEPNEANRRAVVCGCVRRTNPNHSLVLFGRLRHLPQEARERGAVCDHTGALKAARPASRGRQGSSTRPPGPSVLTVSHPTNHRPSCFPYPNHELTAPRFWMADTYLRTHCGPLAAVLSRRLSQATADASLLRNPGRSRAFHRSCRSYATNDANSYGESHHDLEAKPLAVGAPDTRHWANKQSVSSVATGGSPTSSGSRCAYLRSPGDPVRRARATTGTSATVRNRNSQPRRLELGRWRLVRATNVTVAVAFAALVT